MRRFFMLFSLIFTLSSATAFGQTAGLEIYANGGVSTPFTPSYFSDNWKPNYIWSAGVRLPVSPTLKVGLGFSYNSFLFDVNKARTGSLSPALVVAIRNSRASIAHGDVHLAWWPTPTTSPVRPQLTAGVGLSRIDAPGAYEASGNSENNGAITEESIAGNAESFTPSFHLGTELRFHVLPVTQIVLGVRFSGSPGEKRISSYASYTIGIHFSTARD